ncbi:MAG: methyltransferase domain-containing protein [Proteobacteria bacterium]|nr:methyltransferase domain-containing protein [Pseudomonadota bacterium]
MTSHAMNDFNPPMAMYRWTRLSTQRMEEDWYAKLSHIDPEHLVMLTQPESSALKIQVFGDRKMVEQLVCEFGGKMIHLSPEVWTGGKARAPLSIRGRLRVHSDDATFRASENTGHDIFIPAGMAFGTGDHATTATCLRLLCDIIPNLPSGWRALDAGTGTGILAIAAEKLGASAVEAFDFDPVCIRVSKENAKANRCRKIAFSVADSRRVGAFQKADVILANLYSELLIASAPGLAKKLKPSGHFIFSGVLVSQAAEVSAALEKYGLGTPRLIKRGKWCAGICMR